MNDLDGMRRELRELELDLAWAKDADHVRGVAESVRVVEGLERDIARYQQTLAQVEAEQQVTA